METRDIFCPTCKKYLGSQSFEEGIEEAKWDVAMAPYTCSDCYVPPPPDETEEKLNTLNQLLKDNPAALDAILDAVKNIS